MPFVQLIEGKDMNAAAKRGFRDRRLQTDVGLATMLTTMENKA